MVIQIRNITRVLFLFLVLFPHLILRVKTRIISTTLRNVKRDNGCRENTAVVYSDTDSFCTICTCSLRFNKFILLFLQNHPGDLVT